MSEFVSFMVTEIANGKPVGWGLQVFRVPPRRNEYITKDVGGVGQAYKVLAVMHPLEPTGTAGDLVVEHIGTAVEVLNILAQG